MSDHHMISVIVPVYHAEEKLTPCIESILHQTYPEIELILVDDGSTQEDAAICDAYAASDQRVRVIHQKNSGVSAARNAGLNAAKGEYVFMIDCDDRLLPDVLEQMKNALDNDHTDMAAIGLTYSFADGRAIEKKLPQAVIPFDQSINPYFPVFMDNHFFSTLCAKLYRRDIIEKHHIRCREDLYILEDGSFTVSCLCECRSISVLGSTGYLYTQDDAPSLMKRYHENALTAYEYYYACYAPLRALLNEKNTERYYLDQEKIICNFIVQVYSRSGHSTKQKRILLKEYACSDTVQEVLAYTSRCKHNNGKISRLLKPLKHRHTGLLSLLLTIKYRHQG